MSIVQSILMGLLQGLTEFLPVSSSGHLVAAKVLFGIETPGVLLEVALHFGTLIAVVVVLHAEVWQLCRDGVRGLWLLVRTRSAARAVAGAPECRTALAIIVGTAPAAVVGLTLGDHISLLFTSLRAAGGFIFLTGLIVLATRFAPKGEGEKVGVGRGLLVGAAQAFALLPGISRSGSTIATGFFLGLTRRKAARFSFLLVIPALAGAMLLEVLKLTSGQIRLPAAELGPLCCGMAASAIVGAACLVFLIRAAQSGRFHWFSAYCLPAGALLFVASFFVGAGAHV